MEVTQPLKLTSCRNFLESVTHAFEYRCLLPVFLVINLLQVGLLRSRVLENYLSVPRTEDRRNTEETVAEIRDQKKM